MVLDGIVDHAGPAGGRGVRATGLWRSQESLDCVLTKAFLIADIFSDHFTTAVHEAVKYGKRRQRRLSRIMRSKRGYQIWVERLIVAARYAMAKTSSVPG